jgi:16S rRNA processing protein RimM
MCPQELRPPPDRASGSASGSTGDDVLIVARIGGAYGVKGWVRIVSFTEPPQNLASYRPWLLARRTGFEPLAVEAIKGHGQGFLVKLGGVESRERAQALAGLEIAVPAAALPAPGRDEYYWKDLVGLVVRTRDGRVLGRIERLLATGAHDVLVVTPDGGPSPVEVLIPFVAAVIGDVDLEAGVLVADWEADDES